MRNSEARRYARWSAGVALLLALVVAGVYLRGVWVAKQAEKKAPPAVPAAIEQRSNEFSFSKVEGQRTIYTVRALRTTEFKEGSRNLLEDVSITVYGKKGERNDTLRTRACDFVSSTGKIGCEGEVQMSLQARGVTPANRNAIQVVTSDVSFDRDSGLARTEKAVTFRWPAGEGRAVGVQYDSNDGTLHLEHSVELTLAVCRLNVSSSRFNKNPFTSPATACPFAAKRVRYRYLAVFMGSRPPAKLRRRVCFWISTKHFMLDIWSRAVIPECAILTFKVPCRWTRTRFQQR